MAVTCAECKITWGDGDSEWAREQQREHMMTAHPTYAAAAMLVTAIAELIEVLKNPMIKVDAP